MTRPIHFQTSDERHVEMIPWTEADLSQMAQVTAADIQKVDAYWHRLLPARLRNLLRARSTIDG